MASHTASLLKQMKNDELLEVARLGKCVGLKGGMKLHVLNDFPEIFQRGARFLTKDKITLKINSFEPKRDLVFFDGYDTPELAQKLVNKVLLMSKEQTRQLCSLEKDEFFWFDIEGLSVFEDTMKIGLVDEIERLNGYDFLSIKTDKTLTSKGYSKNFLIPYNDRYIENVDIEKKTIFVKDALALLKSLE